jgi:hypothetical protein
MSKWKPDEISPTINGWHWEYKYRPRRGHRGERARIAKHIGPDGETSTVFHEVVALDGRIIHRDEKPVEGKDEES